MVSVAQYSLVGSPLLSTQTSSSILLVPDPPSMEKEQSPFETPLEIHIHHLIPVADM